MRAKYITIILLAMIASGCTNQIDPNTIVKEDGNYLITADGTRFCSITTRTNNAYILNFNGYVFDEVRSWGHKINNGTHYNFYTDSTYMICKNMTKNGECDGFIKKINVSCSWCSILNENLEFIDDEFNCMTENTKRNMMMIFG